MNKVKIAFIGLFSVFAFIFISSTASAASQSVAPEAKISFTFDDGYASAITQAAPTLAKYGYSATDYVATGCVGMTTAPNTCHANTDATYMSWDQIAQLQSLYKWEIGSHTVSHPYLATSDASDGQPNVLTNDQVIAELAQSKQDLAAHGIDATDFATPYGDYNKQTLAYIAKYYYSQRGFADIGYNSWPNSDYYLKTQDVQGGVSVSTVKKYIDTAIANKQWLILVFHNIKVKPSNTPSDYEYSTANLNSIAAYVKSKNVSVVNVSSGLVKSDVNLLPNSSFNNGISDGWSTDSPAAITADANNNGSYPDPTNSVRLASSLSSTHLFSPLVTVDPNTNYMLKNFINVAQNSGGEVGFYIDEYDGFGNWISGQYKGGERSSFVESFNFSYKPSSSNVSKARLQIIVSGTSVISGITAYLDNSQWFPLTTSAPIPPQISLIANSNFDGGISMGWTTDNPTTITADANSNGSPNNPVNSVKMVSAASNTHLFSPKFATDTTKTYSLTSYLNIKQITGGEVGFYIDEYDINGNWISGQYKTGRQIVGAGTVSFQYKATSSAVVNASMQIIVVGNSGILGYFDDIILTQN